MQQEFPLQITGMAFLLRPDVPPGGVPKKDGGSDLQEPLRSHALEAGLTRMRRAPITSYTMPSLEATEYAKEQGAFEDFHRRCYEALWNDGQDLGDLNVLEGIAVSCGLRWPELKERLDTGYYKERVMQQYSQGLEIGFRGIPAFTFGNLAFTGAVEYDVFKSVAQRAQSMLEQAGRG